MCFPVFKLQYWSKRSAEGRRRNCAVLPKDNTQAVSGNFRRGGVIQLCEVMHMVYRVEYTPAGIRRTARPPKNRRLPLLTAVFFLIFLLIVSCFWPRGMQALRQTLIPGDSAVTIAAWKEMTRELHAGQSVGSAVESFCREIFRNAGLY